MSDATTDTQVRGRMSFDAGSVIQLASDDVGPGAEVVPVIHPVTVTLTDERVSATNGTMEWSWLFDDLESVHHAEDDNWSIFAVPGVTDHGIALAAEDVAAFREQFDGLRGKAAPRYWPKAQPVQEPLHYEPLPPRPTASRPTFPVPPLHVPDRFPAPPVDQPDVSPAVDAPADGNGSLDHRLPDDDDPTIQIDLESLRPPDAGPYVAKQRSTTERSAAGRMRSMAERATRGRNRGGNSLLDAPTSLASLEARNISAWFGAHNVLDRVSLTMEAGEVTALIGPSGCGKSTFLRILNRMHELIPIASLAGEVLLEGHDIYDPQRKLTDARREIGMVFQKPNPFPAMSIYDNTVASLQLTGTKADQATKDELVETCLSKAGLWNEVKDRLRQPGGGLSGGQQQRLCIARALAIKPRVLLMDEPCSALDPTSTRRIEQTIHELKSEVTIVIVTHNMQQALRVSDQCAFFLAEQGTPGVIVEHGNTDAMFHRPQDQRTDDYVNGRFG